MLRVVLCIICLHPFPLVVFIRFIIPYCQAEILTNFALFRPVLHFFNVRAVVCSQSAFVTLLRCASRRDSPSWANLAPAPLADQSSTFVSTSRMVLGNFAENRPVLHGFGFLDVLQDFNPLAVAGSQSAFTQRAHAHLLHFVSRHARLLGPALPRRY